MKILQRKFKFSGLIHEDDVLHSATLHFEQAETNRIIAPNYINVPVGPAVPQYSPTVLGQSTEYDPSGNCEGNFMSYKFQPNNNCYNYSTNVATNSFAQPGRMTGKPLQKGWTGQDVVNGAVSDGLIFVGGGELTNQDLINHSQNAGAGHYVALMISAPDPSVDWPGDYHWARCDDLQEMSWSQKDGGDQVTNFDFAGNLITDPSTANWTVNQGAMMQGKSDDVIVGYELFAYMFVPTGRINII